MIKKTRNFIRRAIYFFIAVIVKWSICHYFINNNRKRVLILRLDGIGDAILWLDSAKEYRTLFPPDQYELTVLCADIWSTIAYELPFFDHIIPLNKKKCYNELRYYYKLLKEVKDAGYDVVINSSYSRDFIFEDTIVWISGAERRIGFVGDLSNIRSWEKRLSDKWYTELISSNKTNLMELERNAEFMRKLGLGHFKSGVPQLPKMKVSIDIPEEEYFVLFPGASSWSKMWPLGNFADIAERLHEITGWVGVICGGANEKILGEQIISNRIKCRFINLCGETTLPELAEIIRNACILISNDTSATHFAAAVSTPSVCILGGGHFGRFLPYTIDSRVQAMLLPRAVFCRMDCYHCNWQCNKISDEKEHYPCIAAITVDQVWVNIMEIIYKKPIHLEDIAKEEG